MTYNVLKDYEDVVEIPIPDSKETRKEVILSLKAGEKFIPAETHYPQNKVDALVLNGTLRLVAKEKSESAVTTDGAPLGADASTPPAKEPDTTSRPAAE